MCQTLDAGCLRSIFTLKFYRCRSTLFIIGFFNHFVNSIRPKTVLDSGFRDISDWSWWLYTLKEVRKLSEKMFLNRRKLKKLGLKFNPVLALIGLRITGPRITDFTNKKFTDSRIRITLHIGQMASPRLEENIAISMISRNLHRKQGLYSFFLNLLTIYELNSYLLALHLFLL